MSLLPPGMKERIIWYEAHIAQFQANAVAIGSSVAETTTLAGKISAARDNLTTQQTAIQAAKTSTETLRTSVDAMMVAGSNLIQKVRTKAATDGDGIYALAGIPAPSTPTPVGPPGMPYKFAATLLPDGSLEFTWKCDNPSGAGGTIYQIGRKTPSDADFVSIGGSGEKKFTDTTIPAGVASVTYWIRAIRSTAMGVANTFEVNFGSSSGTTTAMVVDSKPKLAA